jgi:poly(A) polymerase
MVNVGILTSVPAGALSAFERLEQQPLPADAASRLAALDLTGGSTANLRTAWRLSNATMARVADLVAGARLAGAERWAELSYRHRENSAEAIAIAAAVGGHGPEWVAEAITVVEDYRWTRFPVSGSDLLAMGIEPGPALGVELKRLEALWIDSRFELDKDALLEKARRS